jgi:Cation transporting ATPase, C-terminus
MLIRAWLFLGLIVAILAWLFLGLIVAILSLAGFFYVLTQAGWHSGDPTGAHTRFHHAYQQATTMTFLGVIFGQIGTAFAVRTRRASLRSVGVFSNRYLLWAIAGELATAAVFVFAPPCQALLGTAVPPARDMLLLIPFPFIVRSADELRKWVIRSRSSRRAPAVTPAPRRLTFGRNQRRIRIAESTVGLHGLTRLAVLQQWPVCCGVRGDQRHRRSAVLPTRVRW